MPRPRLKECEKLKDFALKLPDSTIANIEKLADEWDMGKTTAARELLLLGLAVVKASQHSKLIRLAPGLQFLDEPPNELNVAPVRGGKG